MFESVRIMWWLKAGVVVVLVGAAALAILLAALWREHGRETTLPAPTGPFAVGRETYAWSDPGQVDPLAPQPGTKRELAAWIWYPAVARRSPPTREDYLPAPWMAAVEGGPLIIQLLNRDPSRVRVHSIRDCDVAPQQRTYPVVIIRAALALMVSDYTALAEDLASHGYVVVGFDAPYRTMVVVFPDGRVIERAPQNDADLVGGAAQDRVVARLLDAWSADMSFALDQLERLNASDPSGKLTGRLDLQRVGAWGHSLGGAVALQFCHSDPRCKAGIDVDGAPYGSVVSEGVTQPFMFLLSDHGSRSDAKSRQIDADIASIYERLPPDRRRRVMIRGANHYNFSDGAVLKSQLLMGAFRALGLIGLGGRRQLAVTAHCSRSFFDVYLKGAPASQLDSRAEYPEVRYAD